MWAVRSEVTWPEVGRAERHGRDTAASVRTQEHLPIIDLYFELSVSFIEHLLYTEPMLGLKFEIDILP